MFSLQIFNQQLCNDRRLQSDHEIVEMVDIVAGDISAALIFEHMRLKGGHLRHRHTGLLLCQLFLHTLILDMVIGRPAGASGFGHRLETRMNSHTGLDWRTFWMICSI